MGLINPSYEPNKKDTDYKSVSFYITHSSLGLALFG